MMMRWTKEAQDAVSRVPFFVRKRVRKGVEEEAGKSGADEVNMEHVEACQRRFLNNMEDEVNGFQVERCFGAGGCPNRAVGDDDLGRKIEELLKKKDIKSFLKKRVQGPLKLHHEFRVSISDCPNACSRPQIVDVGLIGAVKPEVSSESCSLCGACVQVCREDALTLSEGSEAPLLDEAKCLSCGQCIAVCPSGTLRGKEEGYRILVGGKLGRHPQLARELPGILPLEEALEVIECCIEYYLRHNEAGERFGEVLKRVGIEIDKDRAHR